MGTVHRALYPLRHISIRVPWHDTGWDGTVCRKPKLNEACLRLKRIADQKNDDAEARVAGQSVKDLVQSSWPACVAERATFMAPFELTRTANHPYQKTSIETHGHFAPTPFRHPPYSAACIPFAWMFKSAMGYYGEKYRIDVDPELEPNLPFPTDWVQERRNHRALLDCFFGHFQPEKSLCFLYAKQVPFVEDYRRVLIGVGRVQHIGDSVEYKYQRADPPLRSLLWERAVQHTIRPDFKDGFLLPYQAAIANAVENPEFDPADIVAFAPGDRMEEFSYTSEHVTHDGAIASLLACAAALNKAKDHLPGPWTRCLKWIDDRLGELWKMRGPCPGLGSALCAFGLEYGTFVAREIEAKLGENEDPWPLVDKVLQNPKAYLSVDAAGEIGQMLQKTWKQLPDERRALLKLLSRFEITKEQAEPLYDPPKRKKIGIDCSDSDLLGNPYRIFEFTRLTAGPVSVWTVDRGVYPEQVVRKKHRLPAPSGMDSGTDARRIRALAVQILEEAAGNGSTLLPSEDVSLAVSELDLQPACPVTTDLMTVAETDFAPEITVTTLKNGESAYQLSRLMDLGAVIRRVILQRRKGKRLVIAEDWRRLLDNRLGTVDPKDEENEELARQEKTAALKELAESRVSVLIGPAGTGKTTVLSILCSQKQVAAGGVLLLAPTGKARVRLEQAAKDMGLNLKGFTIAQFLSGCDRYDARTGRYHLSDSPPVDAPQTVIVDESSMLTESMLAALLDALKGVHRLILIGDPRQLPPIGEGRPFCDIIAELLPANSKQLFPCVGPCYAELTVRRRQGGREREDLQLASWFSGEPLEPGEDDIFHEVVQTGKSDRVRFECWNAPEEFHDLLIQVLVDELGLSGAEDVVTFDMRLGANEWNGHRFFNCGAAAFSEKWQILSPVRGRPHGVTAVNRLIHQRFRAEMLELARRERYRKIPRPMGPEEIVYGDKVINNRNHAREKVYPPEGAVAYVANGEIGVVVGQYRTRKFTKPPWLLKVEFSSQPGYQYDFGKWDFKEEGDAPLELAYALTVHKAQGSQFNLVILVLPNPCRLLSRELLYTAMTRQCDRIVILHQGSRADLKKFASDRHSETAVRLTNLFRTASPVEVDGVFFEEGLIHRTRRGELVRSKSEVIIADGLDYAKVDYAYEKELVIDGVSKYPDFTIEDTETGRTFYWEHCGMLHNPDYRRRWELKLAWYKLHDIIPYTEGEGDCGTLIVTRDTAKGGISSQAIKEVIDTVILG
jgi:ATP-dependent exoDNAse (exonuclease V) alpha subunit